MTNLFNARALQRRHRVGERGGPITLLSPPLKLTLALGVVIAVAGGFWATLARIPLTVTGTGVLLPVGSIDNRVSQIDGEVHWMFDQPPADWHTEAWRFQARPDSFDDQAMASLARRILIASEASYPASQDHNAEVLLRFRDTRFPRGRLLLWVQSETQKASLASALDQLARTLRANAEQQRNITSQQTVLRREFTTRSGFLASMKKLEGKGFMSRASILEQQATVDGIASQIHSNDNQLIALDRDRDRAYQAVQTQLVSLLQQQLIFAPHDVYLDQVNAQNREAVSRGQQLLRLSDRALDNATLVPVFFGSHETAQVRPGMAALATPAGYKRAEVGGIRGRVVFKARLPGDLDSVTARTGVASVAQLIMAREPSPTLVVLALERARAGMGANSGGYRWTSRSDLPFAPIPGERLDVEITTREVRPIELVLPALRQVLGFTPPEPPASAQKQSIRP
jgi:hypothetical protein